MLYNNFATQPRENNLVRREICWDTWYPFPHAFSFLVVIKSFTFYLESYIYYAITDYSVPSIIINIIFYMHLQYMIYPIQFYFLFFFKNDLNYSYKILSNHYLTWEKQNYISLKNES